jgi:hypothetical protein
LFFDYQTILYFYIMEQNNKLINNIIYTYSIDIDFDEASKEWKKNKIKLDNGCYKYICGKTTKTGKKCKNKRKNDSEYCFLHSIA